MFYKNSELAKWLLLCWRWDDRSITCNQPRERTEIFKFCENKQDQQQHYTQFHATSFRALVFHPLRIEKFDCYVIKIRLILVSVWNFSRETWEFSWIIHYPAEIYNLQFWLAGILKISTFLRQKNQCTVYRCYHEI